MEPEPESDPTVVRSVAVHVEDVVAAVQARREGRPAVLRVTPPFSGRMRARLHVEQDGEKAGEALHLPPDRLLGADAPGFPTAAGTEDRLRASDRPDTPEHRRELHLERIADWREAVADHVVDRLTVETAAGPHEVRVLSLG
jgi:hypothetical protein